MSDIILLDAGPLGLATQERSELSLITSLDRFRQAGALVAVPEIADYEVRRELVRGRKLRGLARLERFIRGSWYVPISTQIMRTAADLWADARNRGRPTAGWEALDGDVILAATARQLEIDHRVVVATDNIRHLGLFVDARHWSEIEF